MDIPLRCQNAFQAASYKQPTDLSDFLTLTIIFDLMISFDCLVSIGSISRLFILLSFFKQKPAEIVNLDFYIHPLFQHCLSGSELQPATFAFLRKTELRCFYLSLQHQLQEEICMKLLEHLQQTFECFDDVYVVSTSSQNKSCILQMQIGCTTQKGLDNLGMLQLCCTGKLYLQTQSFHPNQTKLLLCHLNLKAINLFWEVHRLAWLQSRTCIDANSSSFLTIRPTVSQFKSLTLPIAT